MIKKVQELGSKEHIDVVCLMLSRETGDEPALRIPNALAKSILGVLAEGMYAVAKVLRSEQLKQEGKSRFNQSENEQFFADFIASIRVYFDKMFFRGEMPVKWDKM